MAVKPFNVVVAGHLCVDITPKFLTGTPGNQVVFAPGKLTQMDGIEFTPGGVVANTGITLQKLGADVSLIGKTGCDELGSIIISNMQKHHHCNGIIKDSNTRTSYTVVLAPPGVDRIFLHDPAANDSFNFADLDFKHIGQYSHFHFGYPPLMAKMWQNDGDTLCEIFRKVKSIGLSTSLDLAAIDSAAPVGKANWRAILSNVLKYVDIFLPSAEEIAYILNPALFTKWNSLANGSDISTVIDVKNDIVPMAQELLAMGAKAVVIKCGVRGIYLQTACALHTAQIAAGTNAAEWANQSLFEECYKPLHVASATGAGDVCIATFLYGVSQGLSPAETLRLASGAGACCVEHYDAHTGIESYTALQKRIARGWKKHSFGTINGFIHSKTMGCWVEQK